MQTVEKTMYKFKPFDFKAAQIGSNGRYQMSMVYGNSDEYFIASGFPYPHDLNSLFVECYWKCNISLGQRRMIKNKNPQEQFRFYSTILSGNMLIKINSYEYHDVGVYSNIIYLGNLSDESEECEINFKELEVYGDFPKPNESNYAYLINDEHVYFIYRVYDNDHLEVRRLDLSTRMWELLYTSECVNYDQEPRFADKLIFYKGSIYIFGSKDNSNIRADSEGFMKIYKFDTTKKNWEVIPVNPECWPYYSDDGFILGCVQYPEMSNMVYMISLSGGGGWRFDIDNLQWANFNWILPQIGMITRTTFVTPSGRMCCYGHQVIFKTVNEDVLKIEHVSDDTILSAWVTIPKLKFIAWEAIIHYFKEPMLASSYEHLRKIGIPKEFCDSFFEGRSINI